jgi:DNA-binding GntR family transcriptional regulator
MQRALAPPLEPIAAPTSLKEMAFQALKNAIMSNRLEPGGIYNESGLAKQLGISKTPVREAVLDLAARGFLTVLPRRGIVVNTLTAEDIQNLYEYRSAIERAAIRRITPDLQDGDLKEIRRIIGEQHETILADARREYLSLDREFHFFLCSLTQNPYMISALENIRDLVDWMGWKTFARPERLREIDVEHERIIDRLKARDAEGAEMMMARHINISLERILSEKPFAE